MAPDARLDESTATAQQVVLASQEAITYHWPYIRRGLMKVLERQDRHCHWQPEHVRQQVLNNQAEMYFVIEPDGDQSVLLGFFVTSVMMDPFVHFPIGLFVWVAYANGPALETGLHYLDHLARQRGLRFIETISPRPGLVRKLTRRGWRVSDYVLRKDT